MSTSPAKLYERDFVRWTEAQAAELRRAAEAGVEQIVLHPLKLQHSPATDPRGGWEETIDRERSEIDEILTESPSLRQEIGPVLARRWPLARRRAVRALAREVSEGALTLDYPFTVEQLLDPNWWPERTAS